ncbi:MAG: N-methyl-L-tryptophan oxidase [Rhizobiales bacterium]|nr:N-methyl-L-tryptophan oxidase [Hyphomicrobiales bacterium]
MARATADIVVLGLGAMGAASLRALTLRGARPLGIDQFAPPHDFGSSHGETRITRCATGESEALAPFALRSQAIWREIEAETGARLFVDCGCLLISRPNDVGERHGRSAFLERTVAAARRYDIAHELLDADEIARRHPQFRPRDDEQGYFEPGAGYVRPEAAIAAQLDLARAGGATLRLGARVEALRIPRGAGPVEIVTGEGVIEAGRVVVSAGAWAAGLLGPRLAALLRPTRQVLHWFPVLAQREAWAGGPTYIWMHGTGPTDFFYGFPGLDGEAKCASETYEGCERPDSFDRVVAPEESRAMAARHLEGRLAGIGSRAARAKTCLYTQTPDSQFVIDAHPDCDRVLIVSPCSGHGFKHSAAIGEAAAGRVLDGASRLDLTPFALGRFAA